MKARLPSINSLPMSASTVAVLCALAVACGSPDRVVVIKSISPYGDYEERDHPILQELCASRLGSTITQNQFDEKYSGKLVRRVQGQPIGAIVQTQFHEQRKETEEYTVEVAKLTWLYGVAMNDGAFDLVKKTREVTKDKVRHVYAKCTALEYHF